MYYQTFAKSHLLLEIIGKAPISPFIWVYKCLFPQNLSPFNYMEDWSLFDANSILWSTHTEAYLFCRCPKFYFLSFGFHLFQESHGHKISFGDQWKHFHVVLNFAVFGNYLWYGAEWLWFRCLLWKHSARSCQTERSVFGCDSTGNKTRLVMGNHIQDRSLVERASSLMCLTSNFSWPRIFYTT